MSNAETITVAVISFFVLLLLLTFARLVLRKTPPNWRRFRIGMFVERDPDDRNNEERKP